jgi:predicted nucleic acid-binding Zn ribbon protein
VGIFGKKLENLCGGRPETIEEAGRERKRKAVLLFFLLLKANRMPFVSRS